MHGVINLSDLYNNKRVLIMGLGLQGGGVAAAKFFLGLGAQVTVTDLKSEETLKESIDALKDFPVRFVIGKHNEQDFIETDLILINPGVPLTSPFLALAEKHHVPFEMAESLFMKLCPVDVIGVTGTRGKSTTTQMIAAILKKAGYDVLVGGNVPNNSALSLLDHITGTSKVVLELSSFQLAFFHKVKKSPHIAVLTNIYPDHLNRYKDMEEYFYDKSAIYLYQTKDDYLVLNAEHEVLKNITNIPSQKVEFSKNDISYDLSIPGSHNKENAAAAKAVAEILAISETTIKHALQSFHGLSDRLEVVTSLDGVTFVNDSASTTPVATIKALESIDGPKILIAGGNTKNLPLDELVSKIKQTCKAVVLLDGSGTQEFSEKLKKKDVSFSGPYNDLTETIKDAQSKAEEGDTVLFSPGFTSFALFDNEFDRGAQFKEKVLHLG